MLKILNYVVPEDLKPFVDFDTLKQLPDMHVSRRMLISQSDTIYEAKLNENAEDLGELRAEFLALKHAHDKKYFLSSTVKSIY